MHRKRMQWLYYGQYVHGILFLLLVKSPYILINQLINLWIIYLCYATMHFCQTLFLLIFMGFELFQVLGIVLAAGSFLTLDGWLSILIFIYDVVAVFWIY